MSEDSMMTTWRAAGTWVLAAHLTIGAGAASAQSLTDPVVEQLREQGYVAFEVSRTLLGRVRVIAQSADGGEREIVFNPSTGEILRDYFEAPDGTPDGNPDGAPDSPPAPRVMDRSDDAPAARSGGTDDEGRGQGGNPQGNGNAGGNGNGGGSGNGNGSQDSRGNGRDGRD